MKGLFCVRGYYGVSPSLPLWLGDYIKSIAEAPHLIDPIELENARACHFKDDGIGSVPNIRAVFEAGLNVGPNPYPIRSTTCSCAEISGLIRAFWEALTAVVHMTMGKVRKAGVTGLHRDN